MGFIIYLFYRSLKAFGGYQSRGAIGCNSYFKKNTIAAVWKMDVSSLRVKAERSVKRLQFTSSQIGDSDDGAEAVISSQIW